MSGRMSSAVERALALVRLGRNISEAARAEAVDVRSLRRAMRREGEAPRAAFSVPGPRAKRLRPAPGCTL